MGSITVREIDELEEEVVVVQTEGGTVVCAGTKGGPEVEQALVKLLETFIHAGGTPPVFLFVDQITSTIRQLRGVTGIRPAKSISPPGSGLDGLLDDIRRDS